jgi:hypothetical protein
MANLDNAKLELYIYGGASDNIPPSPDYTITKSPIPGEQTVTFEISELVKDYIDIEFDGDYDNIKQTKWVFYRVTRKYDDTTTDSYTRLNLAFRGYGEITDGINPELSKGLLISNTVINNQCGEPINVPIYTFSKDDEGATEVQYKADGSSLKTSVLGNASLFTIAQSINVAPSINDVITIDKTASVTSQSDSNVNEGLAPADTDEVEFTVADGTTQSIKIECIDECKNIPHKISFLNKFGVIQDIWFFARKKDSISTERESYKKSTLKTDGTVVSYNISDHQNVYLENQGREQITMNTGFIHESYGEVIKQLMVSEFVYIHDKFRSSPSNASYDLAVPINVVTGSLDIKTRRYDKLINYELQFQGDSELIQSIR